MNVVRVDIDMHLISAQRGSGWALGAERGADLNGPAAQKSFLYIKKTAKRLLDPDVRKDRKNIQG